MSNDEFRSWCATASICLVLGVFPLFTFGSYFGISAIKMGAFAVAVAVGALPILIYNIISGTVRKNYIAYGGIRATIRNMRFTDWAMVAFTAACVLSTLFSKYSGEALTGFSGRYQGLYVILLYAVLYWQITRYYIHKDIVWIVFMLSGSLACIIAIFQHYGLDIFNFYYRVAVDEIPMFISTIGNINFFASFTCLLAPVAIFMYVKAKTRKSRIFYMITGIIIFAGSACSNSDGAILGVGSMSIIMAIYFARNKELFSRCLEIMGALFLTLQIVVWTTQSCPGAVQLTGVVEELGTDGLLLAGTVAAVIMRVCCEVFWKKDTVIVRRILLVIAIIFVVAVGAVIFYVNVIDRKVSLGGFTDYLRFTSEWGTLRGREYKAALAMLAQFDGTRWLFGGGLDVYGLCFKELLTNMGFYSVSAHCEYLHYLVTTGIIGTAAYFAYAGGTVVHGIRNRRNDATTAALFASGAYLVEAAIGIAQIFTTPVFFCLMAMVMARRNDEEAPEAFSHIEDNDRLMPERNEEMENETLATLKGRCSIRKYKSEQITNAQLDAILEAGTYAPTGMNSQSPLIAVVQDKDTVAKLSRMNAEIMGSHGDPFYGAPTVLIVFSDSNVPTYVENGSLVMGNLMNAAYSVGVDSCWIHRAREMFETEEGKAMKKAWGIADSMKGIGNCILGYRDGEPGERKPRKEGYIVYVK